MTALRWSRLGVAAGGLLVVLGVGLGVGLALALIIAGVLLVAGCLLLVDVDVRPRVGGVRR